MRTAAQRWAAVHEVMTAARVSERRACRFTGVARSTQRYLPARDDRELRARLETLAILKPRWGYRRLHWLLEHEGTHVNRKRVLRVYRDAGLRVRRRRRKRVSVARIPATVPARPNERWSMDFMSDTLGDGRTFRIFTLVDDCARSSPGLLADFSLGADRITRFLNDLPRPADGPGLRQRAGVHEPMLRPMGTRARRPLALHSAGQARRQLLHREFQRAAARRVLEPELVCESPRRAADDRGVARRVQRRAAAQRPRGSNPGRVCGVLPEHCTFNA